MTDYSPELAAEFCRLLTSVNESVEADGSGYRPYHSIRSAAAALGCAPSSIVKWLGMHDEFAAQYARARKVRGALIADEVLHVADHEPDAARARVRMDARKWYAGKLDGKEWGDKVMGDKDNPLVHEVKDESSVADLRSRIARLVARGAEGSGDQEHQP